VASKDPALPPYKKGYPFPGDMLGFSSDSRSVVESFGTSIPFWDAANGALAHVITNASECTALAFTPEGKNLLVGSPSRISVLDLATGTFGTSFPTSCRRIAVSADGKLAAVAPLQNGRSITVRDVPNLRIRSRLTGHTDAVYWLAFSHDRRLLASASWDGTVRIWQVATGNELLSIPSQSGVVWCVAFSPDDRTLAFGSGSGSKRNAMLTFLRAASDADVARVRKIVRRASPPRSYFSNAIPARSAQCPSNLINLSDVYDATLPNFNITLFTPGIQTLGGVQFDARGILQLSCSNPEMGWDHPASVKGIRVGHRCPALHFLHASSWEEEGGTMIGEYVIHFADGRQARVPLVYGENILDGACSPDEPTILGPTTRTVWREENAVGKSWGKEFRFYDFRWQNPHPESEIESIDCESSMTQSAPYLVAITAED